MKPTSTRLIQLLIRPPTIAINLVLGLIAFQIRTRCIIFIVIVVALTLVAPRARWLVGVAHGDVGRRVLMAYSGAADAHAKGWRWSGWAAGRVRMLRSWVARSVWL
jgi:hypothetical protein